jgi:nucleotide-binding universal stress UspA family protein
MRLDTVVIGIDFSAASVATAQWVAASFAAGAELVLVHVIEPLPRSAFLVVDTPADLVETEARAEAENQLKEVARALGRGTRMEVRVGRASTAIAQLASDCGADLIVVGAHGAGARESLWLGTTADTLVRSADVPVLVGARSSGAGHTRVIASVDSTPMTTPVLDWAGHAMRTLGGRLTILHAIEPGAYSHMASLAAAHAHGDAEAERREIEEARRQEAAFWLAESAKAPVDHERTDLVIDVGPAAEAILRHAEAENAALIVVGRHVGITGFPSRLGRTVRHVLHEARCSVLVVPPA